MSILKVNDIRRATTGSAALVITDPVIITTGSISASVLIGALPGAVSIGDGTISKEKLTNDARDWVNILNKPGGIISSSAQIPSAVSGTFISPAGITGSGVIFTSGTFSGSGAGLSAIPNSALVNNTITINGVATALGSSRTLVTADIAESINLYYTDTRVKAKLNADAVISSSEQVNYQAMSGQFGVNVLGSDGNKAFTVIPGIFITGSTGIDITTDAPNAKMIFKTVGGTVSSSGQVKAFLPADTVSSSAQYPGWVTASSQIDYNSIQNKLSGVVSSSTQVQPLLPGGTVSSSGQVDYNSITNKLSGVYSSSAQAVAAIAAQTIAPSIINATSIQTSGAISIRPGVTNVQSITLFDSNYGLGVDGNDIVIFTNATQGITFKAGSSGYNGTSVMRILGSGNVGIGTITPGALLHVQGSISGSTIQISGNATIGGVATLGNASSGNTVNYIVQRDALGDFAGRNITANYFVANSGLWVNVSGTGIIAPDTSTVMTTTNTATTFHKATTFNSSLTASGHIVPAVTDTIDLGSPTAKFRDLYLSGSTIYLGTLALKDQGGALVVTTSGSSVPAPASGSFTGSFTGSFNGTFPYASLTGIPSGIASGSAQVKNYLPTDTVSSSVQVKAFLPGGSVSASGQVDVRNTTGIATIATTGSNIFVGNQTISGSTTITGNLTVQGTSSVLYVTSSQLDVGSNKLTLNTTAVLRYGGINVYDSGSITNQSGSLLWDSVNNVWLFVHSGTSNTSSIVITGPENTGALGSEAFLTTNLLPKAGVSGDHIVDSQISDNGTQVGIAGSLRVTGSITASAVSGALTGTFPYASLTGIPSGIASGSEQVKVYLPADTVSSSTQVKTFLPNGTVSSSAQYPGWVTASSQIDYNSITNKLSGVVSSSAQVQPLLPAGTLSSSTQVNAILDADGVFSSSAQVIVQNTTGIGALATTGSNTFIGNQIISGSVTTTTGNVNLNGSVIVSGALVITGSVNNTNGGYTGSFSGSHVGTFPYASLTGIPGGIVSSSLQINTGSFSGSFTGTIQANNGVVSSSTQIAASLPASTVSSSTQVQAFLPAGTVSSSGQVSATSTTGFTAGVQQVMSDNNVHSGSWLGTATTNNLTEGFTNLYYTDARVKTKMNADGVHSGSWLGSATTTNLAEGTNLYFTNTRVVNALPTNTISSSNQINAFLPAGTVSSSNQVNLAQAVGSASYALTASYAIGVSGTLATSTDGLPEGFTNLYYLDSRVKTKLNADNIHSGSWLGTATTTNLTEGINLYFTNARVVNALPSGTVSSSAQVSVLIPAGTISSSAQTVAAIANQTITPTAINATNITASIVSGALTGSFPYAQLLQAPTGIISSSAQIVSGAVNQNISVLTVTASIVSGALTGSFPYSGLTGIPSGIISSSTQVDYNSITNKLSGVYSSSTQAVAAIAAQTIAPSIINATGVISGASIQTSGNATIGGVATLGNASSANTVNYIVQRDALGDFAGRNITAAYFVANSGFWVNVSGTGIIAPDTSTVMTTTNTATTFHKATTFNAGLTATGTILLAGIVSQSSQIDYNSITNKLSGVYSSSTQAVAAIAGQTIAPSIINATGAISGASVQTSGIISIRPGVTNVQSITLFDSNYGLGVDGNDIVIFTNATQGITFKAGSSGYNGTSVMRILGSGNVGINDTSPGTKLVISHQGTINTTTPGTTLYNIHFTGLSTNDNAQGITFNGGSSGAQAGLYVQGSSAYGTKMYFATTDSYAAGSKTRMMIDHSGNVGIGTTSPSDKLHVEGQSVLFKNATSDVTHSLGNSGYGWKLNYSNGKFIWFTNTADRMALDNNGNVGIGTTSPNARLEVNGVVSGSGNYRMVIPVGTNLYAT